MKRLLCVENKNTTAMRANPWAELCDLVVILDGGERNGTLSKLDGTAIGLIGFFVKKAFCALLCTPDAPMNSFLQSEALHIFSQIVIGAVWVFHGLYSKLLNGIPRHRLIVGKVLGVANAGIATKAIGLAEVLLGIWAFTGWQPVGCAVVQTSAIVAMNTLEILLAGELLVSAVGMVSLNLGFLSLVWHWAMFVPQP